MVSKGSCLLAHAQTLIAASKKSENDCRFFGSNFWLFMHEECYVGKIPLQRGAGKNWGCQGPSSCGHAIPDLVLINDDNNKTNRTLKEFHSQSFVWNVLLKSWNNLGNNLVFFFSSSTKMMVSNARIFFVFKVRNVSKAVWVNLNKKNVSEYKINL